MSETAEAADGQAVQYPASGETYSEYPEQYYEQPEAPRSFMQKLMANKIVLVGTIAIIVIMLIAAAVLAGGGGGILGSSTPPPAAPSLVAMTGDIPKQDAPQVATGQSCCWR